MTLWHENTINFMGITTTTMMNRSKTIGMSILLIQNLMTMTLVVRYNIIAMAGVATGDVR
jgi:hypothetical protein